MAHRRLALLALPLVVFAWQTVAAQTGGISGTVASAADGTPLLCEVQVLSETGHANFFSCDTQGAYAATGLAAGSYTVLAWVPSQPDFVHQFYDGTVFLDEATPVVVADNQVTTGIDLRLELGGRVSGTVKAQATGEVLGNVLVSLYLPPVRRFSTQTHTDSSGDFSLAGIPPGSFMVQASDVDGPHVEQYWDHAATAADATAIVVEGTEEHAGVDFDLLVQATISGQVVDDGDITPVAGAYVEAIDLDDRFRSYTTTDAGGGFLLGKLAPATYRVWAEAEGTGLAYYQDPDGDPVEIPLAAGDSRSGVVIRLAQGGTISGRVVRAADDSPVANGYVQAWRPSDLGSDSDTTDSGGAFAIDGLPAGVYRVTAVGAPGENLVPQTYADADGVPIDVEVEVGEEVSDVLFELEPGGIVTGTVRTVNDGEPAAGVYVAANQIGGALSRDDLTGTDGSFNIAGLEADDYLVLALHPDYVRQVYDGAVFDTGGTPVQVTVGDTTSGIDFLLEGGGMIAGTVTSAASGEPLEGIWLGAFLDEATAIPGTWAATGADGSYLLGSVSPGQRVFVHAFDDTAQHAWEWYDGAFRFADATPVPVILGQVTAGVDLILDPPGAVTLSQTELVFFGDTLQQEIPPQTVTITNTGPGAASLNVFSTADWLCTSYDHQGLLLEAGEALEVEISAWPQGLAQGVYSDAVRIHNFVDGSEQTVSATLTLVEAPPRLGVAPHALWFDAEVSGADPAPVSLYLANHGGGTLTFSAAADAAWLTVAPSSGTLVRGVEATELVVTATAVGLDAGSYPGTLTITTSQGDHQVQVDLEVAPPAGGDATIAVPGLVTVVVPGGSAPPPTATATFEVTNSGVGTLYWSARTRDTWLALDPSSGTIQPGGEPAAVTLTVDTAGLPQGVSSSYVYVASSRTEAAIEVQVQIGSDIDPDDQIIPSANGQLVVPVLAHGAGVGDSRFVSDLWIAHRPSGRTVEATLSYVPDGADGTELAITTPLTFASGETLALLDFVGLWLGEVVGRGCLVIRSDLIDELEVVSRTYNTESSRKTDDGVLGRTFGQEILGVSSNDGVGRLDGSLYIPGLERSESFRSNLLVTEITGEPVRARVELRGADGASLGATEIEVKAFATTQVNDVFTAVGHVGTARAARAEVEIASGEGRIVALGSVLDNITHDPTTLAGVGKDSSIDTTVVPVVAHAPGVAGTQWVSDVNVSNVDTVARQLTISYSDTAGQTTGTRNDTLPPGQTLQLADVVGSFGHDSSRGSLRIDTTPAGGLAITSRTYNQGVEGTFGQGVPGVASSVAVGAGSDVLRLIALQNTERYRTNVGLTELAGQSARVGITLYDRSGSAVLGSLEVVIPARGQFQTNVFDAAGLASSNVFAATAIIQVVSGSGEVTAYASTVDNATGDGTTLPPPQRVSSGEVPSSPGVVGGP